MSEINRVWRLERRPEGAVRAGDLMLHDEPMPRPGAGEVLVETAYLSLDPTNRLWMSARKQYMPPVPLGEVMRGTTVGRVIGGDGLPAGTPVAGAWGWQSHAALPAAMVNPLPDPLPGPLPAFLNALGFIGATAWFGMADIVRAEAGQTLVVTAAAGAVGSIAGQLGKVKGARVVGIAGGPEKCRFLTDELGFDAAIDYRAGDIGAALDEIVPEGIDLVFENVGGEIFDAILYRLNNKARIALCGLIATYNQDEDAPGPKNFPMLLMRRATVQGFIVSDHIPRFGEFFEGMAPLVMSGQVKAREDIVDGLENALTALGKLFDGSNKGKLMVRVKDDR